MTTEQIDFACQTAELYVKVTGKQSAIELFAAIEHEHDIEVARITALQILEMASLGCAIGDMSGSWLQLFAELYIRTA